MYFAGHLQDKSIVAGIGLGNMTINLFLVSILESFNQAIETLATQAYGSGNLYLCGLYLNRARLIVLLVLIPALSVLLNMKYVYMMFGQEPIVVNNMQNYIIAYLPGLIIFGFNDIQRRFLNSLGQANIPMICLALGQLLHGPWVYLLAVHMDLGIQGIGFASTITNMTMLISMLIMTSLESSISEANFLPNKQTFKGIGVQMEIALPIMMMNMFDWWVYDLMIFMAGMYGVS